ncbi:hypothetical protein HGRIS_013094 [Hohenbuehelia grisea]|uniref:Anaphase-promoting complex subunit 5 n=1 Tax=Hohenbuehelia grisea TaxID=104357 RepID=A0ABR3IUJ2_9AGAR
MVSHAPPPTNHVLRPHHISLLVIFMIAFKDMKEMDQKLLSSAFLLHMYRMLLNETAEIAPPKTWPYLLHELSSGPIAEVKSAGGLLAALRDVNKQLKTPQELGNFFSSIPSLFLDKGFGPGGPLLTRHTIFGYFCRRCFVSFLKLSYTGLIKLHTDYMAWCAGDLNAGYEVLKKDMLDSTRLLLFKTPVDKQAWAHPQSYEAFEKGLAIGDETVASENLRRFFEQRFHLGNDSGLRQQAILSQARMHYIRQEWTAARKLLSEAITSSRTTGDRITLQHSISLMHRLPSTEPSRKPILNEIQPDLHPLEILYDIKKLMDVDNDQPLGESFNKIAQAMGVYDHLMDSKFTTHLYNAQWAQHCVQSVVWDAMGCPSLASIEEDVVFAFTEVGGDDNNRLTVLLNRAYRKARFGYYEDALSLLLEPSVWRGLAMHDYSLWANQIWHILALRASRQGQERLYLEMLEARRPPGDLDANDYFFRSDSPRTSKIRAYLRRVIQMRDCDQATTVVDQLLTALWHSEFQGRLHLYRTGIILLADVGLELGMTKRSQRVIKEIMPQIIAGDDREQRAFACFVLGKCIIAAGKPSEESLREALSYLRYSESDYHALQCWQSLSDVQYFISVVHHNLGNEHDRDEATQRHFASVELQQRTSHMVSDDMVEQILSTVVGIGTSLASR